MIDIKPSLDTEWIAAERRLGEYWRIRSLTELKNGWEVVATDGRRIVTATGSTPAMAIRRLAPVADPHP